MNAKIAQELLTVFSDKFLIVGYKPDGRRGIPATYERVLETANDEISVYQKIPGLTAFRVLTLSEEIKTETEWLAALKEYQENEIEVEERQRLQELKDKYENK